MAKVKDIRIGARFGRLVVIDGPYPRMMPNGKNRAVCKAQCDCGNVAEAVVYALGNSINSCGCLQQENRITCDKKRKTHGMKNTPTYRSWKCMISRCKHESNPSYHRYGGRGIKVCERWRTFENFLADMGIRPEGTTLDRIDSEKDYEPGNCRWATGKEQQRNKQDCVYLTVNGETLHVIEAAERFGIPAYTLRRRVQTGWNHEDAVTKPIKERPFEINGKQYSLIEASREFGIPTTTICSRLKLGWSLEDAATKPKVEPDRKFEIDGQMYSLKEAAKKLGIRWRTISCRLERGWDLEDALRPTGNKGRIRCLT